MNNSQKINCEKSIAQAMGQVKQIEEHRTQAPRPREGRQAQVLAGDGAAA